MEGVTNVSRTLRVILFSVTLMVGGFFGRVHAQSILDDPLSLEMALRRGLLGHPELQREWERLAARKAAISAEWKPFSPQIQFSLTGSGRQTPVAGPFLSYFYPEPIIRSQQLDATVGLQGHLPLGTNYELQLGQSVFAYSSISEPLNPRLLGNVRLRLTQPLFRGAGLSQNLRDISRAQLDFDEELASAKERVQDRAREVSEAFYAAERSRLLLDLRRRSVDMGKRFEDLTRKLIQAGRQTQSDLLMAERNRKSRETELLDSENQLADSLRALEQVLREMGEASNTVTAAHAFSHLSEFSSREEDFIQLALNQNPTLSRLRAQLKRAELEAQRAQDDLKADVRVVVEGEWSGLSGRSTCTGGYLPDGISMCGVPEMFRGGWDRQMINLASGKFYSGKVGIEGNIPLGNAPQQSRHEQRLHQVSELRHGLSLEERRQEISARRAFREMSEREQLWKASQQIVSLAQKTASAEETKLQAGRATLLDVVNSQEMLVGAELQELDSRIQRQKTRFRAQLLAGVLQDELERALEQGASP